MLDATGMPQTAVVIGGSSGIAWEILELLAQRRLQTVVLAGRSLERLEEVAAQLQGLGVSKVHCRQLDVTATATLDPFVQKVVEELDQIDLVLVAAGQLGTAVIEDLDAASVESLIAANFSGPAALVTGFVEHLVRQGSGRVVLLSSVAGVRVRKANFVYGSAKAGLDGFGLGLSDALAGSGVSVTVVRPGFVKTKMTAGLKAPPFSVSARTVAEAVVRGLETGQAVVWVPSQLRWLFALLRLLPQSVWRRLSL